MSKNHHKSEAAVVRRGSARVTHPVGLLAPKNNPNPGIPGIQGQYKTLETLPLGLKARGRIYIYIYI